MINFSQTLNALHGKILSEETRKKSELIVVRIAIFSFLLHLSLIGLVDLHLLQINDTSGLLKNPIVAIYTPFSFILIYEVYLLVHYLPRSITLYIGKQYEIITLVVIRRIFKDLSKLEFTSDWFTRKNDLQFTYDIIAVLILFFLILLFYRLNPKKVAKDGEIREPSKEMVNFIQMKKTIATFLVPLFLLMATFNLGHWVYENFFSIGQLVGSMRDINTIFFDEFFTVLILIDVLLLLISFLHTDEFNKVIRNSGFIISTILIKLSFSLDGLLNTVLTVVAVLIGVIFLAIHNQYDRLSN
ncbi:MAG: hypothetical protein U5L45_14260 [Saprospiraceae bacterium]|nr:hypothetical protein [Saprospiraceae bacterium]